MKKTNGTPFFTEEQKAVIAKTLDGASELDVERFLITCERTGLDPFAKQLFGRMQRKKVKTGKGKDEFKYIPELIIITSIDGFRSIAERSGEYRGQTKAEWYAMDENKGEFGWQDVFIPKRDSRGNPITLPEACRVGIIRQGFAEPCFGYANFESFAAYEYNSESKEWYLGKFWSQMPEHMIAKVAEAQGHRKAFPLLASGLYIEEEIKDEDEPIRSVTSREALPSDTQWVPGHSPEERAGVKLGLSPSALRVETGPVSAPEAQPEPEKATSKVETPKTTRKPATRQEKTPEDPALDPTDQLPGVDAPTKVTPYNWMTYIISQITLPAYKGRALSDLTFDELETLKESWVERHAAKIAANPDKKHEAEQILLAFNARLNEKLKK